MTTALAIDDLVRRVRLAAPDGDVPQTRAALSAVLAELKVDAEDPAWTDGRDIIGSAFELLVPGSRRRTLGQFYTPLGVARVMARWLLTEPRRLVLDPGCGSGALLVAASREDGHGANLLGTDVDPLALEMAAATRRVRGIERLELRRSNFLLDAFDDEPDAVICNPPYTRHHALTADDKAEIHTRLTRTFGVEISRLASLHVLFLARALEVSSPDAVLAFITPAHWLDMRYAHEIKEILLQRAHVEAIISFPANHIVFPHARTTASITLIRKGITDSNAAPTRLIRSAGDEPELLAAALALEGERVVLRGQAKWSRAPRPLRSGTPLSSVAHVRRGVATGFNEYFVLSEEGRKSAGIARSSCRPCIASPKLFPGSFVDADTLEALPDAARRWLINPRRIRKSGPLAKYLDRGVHEFDVHQRALVQQRIKAGRAWYQVEADIEAPILFTYLNKGDARFVRNLTEGVPLNNWLTVVPHDGVNTDLLFEVLQSESVGTRLQDDSRQYGNGMWKLEPSELRQVVLPIEASALSS